MVNQEYLRNKCKKLRWEDDITYKEIAEDILEMNYNSFMNFIRGYKNLGEKRAKRLEEYIIDMT